jgi:hypothetical protein
MVDPNLRLGRTLSYLNLIDLAGSESAKVGAQGGVTQQSCLVFVPAMQHQQSCLVFFFGAAAV